MNRFDNTGNLYKHHHLTIWRLTDGKAGHESQSAGLVNALSKLTQCECIDIAVSNGLEALVSYLTSTWGLGAGLPLPDLIIGAGHATHLHMLAAKRAYGGKTIVLMRPSLPASMFDLCMIPEHDQYHGGGAFIETKGVLNPINAEGSHDANKALIMIGGPSKHCGWDTLKVIAQVYELVKHNPSIEYILTTSRRTPQHFIAAVNRIHLKNLTIVPFENTGKGWVAQRLSESAYAWVTEDSVSMVYEALTAQVAVGLLSMPIKRESRISKGIQQLIQQGLVTRFDFLQVYQQKLKTSFTFAEADRCGQWVLNSWAQTNHTYQPALKKQLSF